MNGECNISTDLDVDINQPINKGVHPRNCLWVVTRNNPVAYVLYMDDEHFYYSILGEHSQDTLNMAMLRCLKSMLKPSSRKQSNPDKESKHED